MCQFTFVQYLAVLFKCKERFGLEGSGYLYCYFEVVVSPVELLVDPEPKYSRLSDPG